MLKLLSSSLLWQLLGGFALGLVGIVAMQPAEATHQLVDRVASLGHKG
ncbi:MAG: hypothetical protein WC803_00990 [Sphingomonas sp.]|jgi:hypothetical protein